MRRFDDACLTPIRPLKPAEIKAIREREHVSKTVFANYLNVTSSLVSKWESGEKRPSGPRSSCYRWSRRMGLPPLHRRSPSTQIPLTVSQKRRHGRVIEADRSALHRFPIVL